MANTKKKSGKSIPGVSRIDQAHKSNHGYYVRLLRSGKKYSRFFSDQKYQGKKKSLAAAKAYYKLLCAKHPPMSRKKFAQIKRHPHKTGVIGVNKFSKEANGKKYYLWQATWSPRVGKIEKRSFAVRKYGETKAKQLALKARSKGLREMAE
jgi:hypothetical protein